MPRREGEAELTWMADYIKKMLLHWSLGSFQFTYYRSI